MTRKGFLFTISMLVTLMFSFAFQSFHSINHLIKEMNDVHCKHHYNHAKTVFSHSHHDFEDCEFCFKALHTFVFNDFLPYYTKEVAQQNIKKIFCYLHPNHTIYLSKPHSRGPPYPLS